MRTNYKKITNILQNNFECEVINSPAKGKVVNFEDQSIRIILVDHNPHTIDTRVGIHLKMIDKNDLEHDLVDAVETALKDMYPAIYIHQKPKDSPQKRERLLKGIQNWIEASEKQCITNHMFKKLFTPKTDTLNSMTTEQLELTLKLIAMGYQKAGEDSRRFRKQLKKESA